MPPLEAIPRFADLAADTGLRWFFVRFAGVLLAADETGVVFHDAFGQIDRELNVAARPEHVFAIGSMTKAFTVVLILQLAEEGRIELERAAVEWETAAPEHPMLTGLRSRL